jgi:PAS domain S-box-containing protein
LPNPTQEASLVTVDVRDLARIQSALLESERRFSLIHDAVPFGIALTKMPDGTLVHVNEAFLRLFELSRDEAIGKTSVQLGLAPPESVSHVGAQLREHGQVRGLEVERVTKSGARLVLSINVDRISRDGGEYVLTTIQDITAARTAAEEALRLREAFLGVAAHELKTPVTTIRAFTELLLRESERRGAIEPALLSRGLQRLDEQTRRLSRLITQLLDVSRIQSGRLSLEISDVKVSAVVRDAVAAVCEGRTDCDVRLFIDDEPTIRADAIRLEQAVSNVLDNALKYGAAPIDVSVRCTDRSVLIAVADSGPGVPVDDRESIFDPLYRARTVQYQPGMGLGLFITKRIIEQHLGAIAVEYPDPCGMRVTMCLPLST